MDYSVKNINFSLDIALHVLILFTFLTIFFFSYISKLTKQSLDYVTNDAINNQTDDILNKINDLSSKYNFKINWNKINDISTNIINKSNNDTPEITENNDRLLTGSIIAIIIAFIIFIVIIIVLKYHFKYDIHIKHILIMNLVIFSLTGLIEYLFFVNVASIYIPVTPNFTTDTMLEEVKKQI